MAEPLRLSALRDDIAARLRPVCSDWPQELFDQVVEKLATITVKYEGISTASTYDMRTTDALVQRLADGLEESAATHARALGLAARMGAIAHAAPQRNGPPRGGAARPRQES
jgi:hypothetical protein